MKMLATPVPTVSNVDRGSCEPRDKDERVKVAIRMRPLNPDDSPRVWRILQKHNSVSETTADGKPLPCANRINGQTFFSLDKTFGEKTTNEQVYKNFAAPVVKSVMRGLNGTVFAYGQTSSGKTYTMLGGRGNHCDVTKTSSKGIVQLAGKDMFQRIAFDKSRTYQIRVSFVEIYNEEVRDLLYSGSSEPSVGVTVREDKKGGICMNANEIIVSDYDSLMSTLSAGEKNRTVSATKMNERSSRSHTIFRITVESRFNLGDSSSSVSDLDDIFNEGVDMVDSDVSSCYSHDSLNASRIEDGSVRVSTLNLVDLAGLERGRNETTGQRQKEGAKINQSLLTLSRVIVALGQRNSGHVNFRDSKLTRILQPSLSGNARVAVICCATPSDQYLEETRSTLQFAYRAKEVKLKAEVNEIVDDRTLMLRMERELAKAHLANEMLKEKCKAMEHENLERTTALNASPRNSGNSLLKQIAETADNACNQSHDEGIVTETGTNSCDYNVSDDLVSHQMVEVGEDVVDATKSDAGSVLTEVDGDKDKSIYLSFAGFEEECLAESSTHAHKLKQALHENEILSEQLKEKTKSLAKANSYLKHVNKHMFSMNSKIAILETKLDHALRENIILTEKYNAKSWRVATGNDKCLVKSSSRKMSSVNNMLSEW
eukprot:CAMPEP_0195539524 /NCGR_PEP_ID=MMETSP0794_2-20130614/50096_1 /TAXON_ID=515487 /ORGANISM="Stephanopyxis turris, Strain CCMP 815" /LENGTH=656 /DNA_ID=CAMNT_0040673561 /DNA_START=809 /DNA_END=2776 /DNA_ORIENTATION=-